MDKKKEEMVVELLKDMPWYEWKRLRAVIDWTYERRANKVTRVDSTSLKNALHNEFEN